MSDRVERRNGERRQEQRRKTAKPVRPYGLPERRSRVRRRWADRRAKG